ncbi:bifunctional 5,10-methylenetetrahydrofolate dehydrogenase/5,10-methenyltetrahydrofolate cyclohydrolase [Colidextribacter sp. OB.20]|uniref:tetrahydrofolate dehydrogenase/cyclohydrolase catalytic domain-containing protein n=1 Tax=Colidextribacter sp. OB.20 TaxID=2304568 RepID=UPI00136F4810|nr:bifunctional 5,10-methylenetetrahydrofolate dehydrogenase/5,10-methenyltetrahydrofolate cyclohydrolase [Colidextribacter sp. OB.20]
MAAVVMDGKALAAEMKEQVRLRTEQMTRRPGMAVVLVGEDPAALAYEAGKRKDCQACGIYYDTFRLPSEVCQEDLLGVIDTLNRREDIDGILLLLPLPGHLDEKAALLAIRPDKDVDCVNPANLGQLLLGGGSLRPCTPAGVMRLLEAYHIDPAGKRCVVVGRSHVVGKPQALLLLEKNGTVTICHSRTPDLAAECRRADILVSAAGRPGLITGDMVKEGAVVIDVAMNRNAQGKLCGDVDYEAAAEKAAWITPVPGGTGPVTRAVLMEQVLSAALDHGKG